MSNLVDELLTYSRIDGRAQVWKMVDLNDVMSDVRGDLQIRLRDTDGRIEWSDLPALQADPTQMSQLFQNLIGNSLKFHRLGVQPVVRISCVEVWAADSRRVVRLLDRADYC